MHLKLSKEIIYKKIHSIHLIANIVSLLLIEHARADLELSACL